MGLLLQKVVGCVARDLERFGEQHCIRVTPDGSNKETLMKEPFTVKESDMVKPPGATAAGVCYCP